MFEPNVAARLPRDKPAIDGQFALPTVADTRRQLHADIAALLLLIRDWAAYLDTLDFLSNQPVTDALRKTCREARDFPCEVPWYRYRIQVQCPTHATLDYISDRMAKHIIHRFDPAFDFLTDSQPDATTLHHGLRRLRTQPWRGKHTTKRFGETDYLVMEEGLRRDVVIYSDRPSKIFPGPVAVAHLDLRHFEAEFCQRRGFRYAADLHPLLDRLDRDPRQIKWLCRDVRLSAINCPRAGLDPQAYTGLPVQDIFDRVRIPRLAQVHVPFVTLLKDRVAGNFLR